MPPEAVTRDPLQVHYVLRVVRSQCCLCVLLLLVSAVRTDEVQSLQPFVDEQYFNTQTDCRKKEALTGLTGGIKGVEDVHVVYASDSKNFPGLFVSMLSLSRHLKLPEQCTIHVIVPDKDKEQLTEFIRCFRDELKGWRRPGVKIHRLETQSLDVSRYVQSNAVFGRPDLANSQAFVRFYLLEYMPGIPRVIWLDTDTVIKTDIAALYGVPMKHALAAAPDVKMLPTLQSIIESAPLVVSSRLRKHIRSPNSVYFSTGVLVFDLFKWRAKPWLPGALENWTARASGFLVDQLALNLQFQHGYDELDWRWNVLIGGWPYRIPAVCVH